MVLSIGHRLCVENLVLNYATSSFNITFSATKHDYKYNDFHITGLETLVRQPRILPPGVLPCS